MKQNFKSILFIQNFAFILLTWICHLNNDIGMFSGRTNEKYQFRRKIDTRNYRLLAKHKQDNDLIITGIKVDTPDNEVHKRKDISYNENEKTEQKNLLSRCSSKNEAVNKNAMKNKSCIFETKKYSNMEKKIFKELDYENFIKNNKTISDKLYKKIMFKKYGLRLCLPLLLFSLLLTSLLLDLFVGCGIINCLHMLLHTNNTDCLWHALNTKLNTILNENWAKTIKPFFTVKKLEGGVLKDKVYGAFGLFGYIIYFIPFIIMGVTIISRIIYYHKSVKKYEKIKFRKR
ncbi:fam-l protein [Plasmodium malariae]|uniref:Fam-l protein n=1 Tax=Plasmodium malariae TaxID=5858 RepID=A0A1D3JH35_PLAMA|nr:fam-l protein [Plasmodium malariae]SBT85612.1 fam-l protein [Plasmodium malariae]